MGWLGTPGIVQTTDAQIQFINTYIILQLKKNISQILNFFEFTLRRNVCVSEAVFKSPVT